MLVTKSLEEFCAVLGSDAPAPGGGSVAALSGALGAELVAMVCRLSIGRKDFEQHGDALQSALASSSALARSLLTRVDLDTEAFNGVMAAFKLPKGTDEEKKARSEAIQKSYREAVQSPLSIAKECEAVLSAASSIVGKSNTNALSDLGVAAQQAIAGLEGAALNVRINLPSIKDEAYKMQIRAELSDLLEQGHKLKQHVHAYVCEHI